MPGEGMPITKQPGQKGNLRIRYAPAGDWLNRMGACAGIATAAAAAAASCMLAAATGAAATCLVRVPTEPAEAAVRMQAAQLSLTKALLLPPACLQLRGQDA